jgi:tetratricopeptide (TPR) repeat protein
LQRDDDSWNQTEVPGSTVKLRPVSGSGTAAVGDGLGERLRQLRQSAGLTQSELARGRFSKEYVSQIERGKTRPTSETIGWLARRLDVDPSFLASGVSSNERSRWEAVLARAEALVEQHRHAEALPEFQTARAAVGTIGAQELELRAAAGEAWARMECGEVKQALALLQEARSLAENTCFSDIDRADVLFRLGVCRYRLSSISTARSLFDEALALAERSGLPCDGLRADIFGWRSRCFRRQRDWQAAREDVERAVELAEALSNPRAAANVYFQASLIAEREGHWPLARRYAERAKAYYEEIADRVNVGRLLNNLGGLTYSLGKPEQAVAYLKDALRLLLEEGSEVDAAHVVCSLAEVHLGSGEAVQAEAEARKALELLGGRVDHLAEIGIAQLTLGRSLLEQNRLDEAQEILHVADSSFEQLASASHRAAVWVAQGDLAMTRSDDRAAARLYRRAAETLQDVRF